MPETEAAVTSRQDGEPTVLRDSRGRFVKGISGNPSGRPVLPPELRKYGRESPGRLRAIADDPDTPVKLKADIERFFFEAVYGKTPGTGEKEDKNPPVQIIRFEGALEQWSR